MLVTGVSGLVGSRVARLAAARGHEVVGTFASRPVTLPGVDSRALDVRAPDAVTALLRDVRPDAVVHLAAIASTDTCAREPALAHAVNTVGALTVHAASRAVGAFCLATSSDLVFDGRRGDYRECDEPSPIGVYAQGKVEMERGLLQTRGSPAEPTPGAATGDTLLDAAVVRLALCYGQGAAHGHSFAHGWLARLRGGETLRAFTDQVRAPIFVADAAAAVLLLAERRLGGVWHVAGADKQSRYAFARALCEAFGVREPRLEATTLPDDGPGPRPCDQSLCVDKLSGATGWRPRALAEGLRGMVEEAGEAPGA